MIPDAICLPLSAVAQQAALDRAAQAANPSRGREVFLQSLAIAVALDFWAWLDLGPAQAVINVLPGEVGRIALPQVGAIVLLPVEMTAPDATRDGLEGDREDGLEDSLDSLDFGLEPLDLSGYFDLESEDLGDFHFVLECPTLDLESVDLGDLDFVPESLNLTAELLESSLDLDDDLDDDRDSRWSDFGIEFPRDARPETFRLDEADGAAGESDGHAFEDDEAIEDDSPISIDPGDLPPIDLPIDWPDDVVAFVPVGFDRRLDRAWLWGWLAVGDVSLPPHAPEQFPTELMQDWEALEPYLQRVRMALAWIAEAADPIAHQVRQAIAPESRSSLVVRLERRYQAAQNPVNQEPNIQEPVMEDDRPASPLAYGRGSGRSPAQVRDRGGSYSVNASPTPSPSTPEQPSWEGLLLDRLRQLWDQDPQTGA